MKTGFIGGGNMASAIYSGMLRNDIAKPGDIVVYDINTEKLNETAAKLGIIAAADNREVVKSCDMIFLSVKPQYLQGVLDEIKPVVNERAAFISIAAGWDNKRLKAGLGDNGRVCRVLPNTPLMVGEGMSAICIENDLTDSEMDILQEIFNGCGKVQMASESQISVISSISGSGPAYASIFIEALADAACLHGLPRDIAYKLAAQTLVGSGKMALETGLHPGEMKDAVCSPAGATIEAVYALERGAFRAVVMDAVDAAVEKFNSM